MIINHNLNSMNAHRNMSFNTAQTGKAMEKLSSGLRINRAGDDAAGLAISEKMRGQIRGLDQATRNSQDSISMIQTAEGALNETHSILQRMRELSVQSSNDTNTLDDRQEIQKEIDQLVNEIDRIGSQTEFNTKKLLNGGSGIVGNTTNANVRILGGTESVKGGGQLILDGVKAASTGTVTFSNAATASASTAAASGTFSLNGVSISMTGSESESQFLSKINEVSTSTGVIASGTFASGITFTTTNTGSSSEIDISGINNVLALGGTGAALRASQNGASVAASTGTLKTTGLDASATIDAGTTGVDPTSITASGNTLTVHGGDYDGLELRINSAIGSSGVDNINVNITANNALTMHIGANENQTMSVGINDMRAAALEVDNLDLTTRTGSETAIASIDQAIKSVSAERSKLGATQNRLEHTINNLNVGAENLQAAESRIRDVDMAKEMMNFTKNNILNQAAQAMMSQSNQQPQAVLQLLR